MEHLTDAPVANILILAGILFVAVGLFGRIGGFIGSIFGNIEAGKNSRVLAGVLGVGLIVGGGWLHEHGHLDPHPSGNPTPQTLPAQPAPKPPLPTEAPAPTSSISGAATAPSSSAAPSLGDRLVGTWVNQDEGLGHINRIEIALMGQDLTVHIWDACVPSNCDMGIHRLNVTGNKATYSFTGVTPGFDQGVQRIGHLVLAAPGTLRLTVDHFDSGQQGQWQSRWVFIKAN